MCSNSRFTDSYQGDCWVTTDLIVSGRAPLLVVNDSWYVPKFSDRVKLQNRRKTAVSPAYLVISQLWHTTNVTGNPGLRNEKVIILTTLLPLKSLKTAYLTAFDYFNDDDTYNRIVTILSRIPTKL